MERKIQKGDAQILVDKATHLLVKDKRQHGSFILLTKMQ